MNKKILFKKINKNKKIQKTKYINIKKSWFNVIY